MEPRARLQTGPVGENLGGAPDEVAAVGGQGWIRGREREAIVRFRREGVVPAERREDGLDLVEPVVAASENVKAEVDFGRSRKDSGAFSFKVRQGFDARDLHYRYYLVKDNGLPNFTPSNPKTRILRQSWQKLPASVARMLSTPLSKYLP